MHPRSGKHIPMRYRNGLYFLSQLWNQAKKLISKMRDVKAKLIDLHYTTPSLDKLPVCRLVVAQLWPRTCTPKIFAATQQPSRKTVVVGTISQHFCIIRQYLSLPIATNSLPLPRIPLAPNPNTLNANQIILIPKDPPQKLQSQNPKPSQHRNKNNQYVWLRSHLLSPSHCPPQIYYSVGCDSNTSFYQKVLNILISANS